MIADWIDEELRNWARWCHSGEFPGPRRQERAASAEGRYLPPSDLGDEPEQPRIRPNRERAERVHHVYLTQLDTPDRGKVAARVWIPQGCAPPPDMTEGAWATDAQQSFELALMEFFGRSEGGDR